MKINNLEMQVNPDLTIDMIDQPVEVAEPAELSHVQLVDRFNSEIKRLNYNLELQRAMLCGVVNRVHDLEVKIHSNKF